MLEFEEYKVKLNNLKPQLEELYEQWSGFAEQLEALESEKEKEQ